MIFLSVDEVAVQSSQVTVVESSKKMMESIGETHPSTATLTEPNVDLYSQHSVPLPQRDTAGYQSLLELRDEALSEKIRKLLLAQSESHLNNTNSKLQWTSNMSHTYDSNVLLSDNSFDSLLLSEGGMENILSTEQLGIQDSVYLQTHGQILPSRIHGNIKAKPVESRLEESILEPAASPEKIPKKKEKSTKDSKKKAKVVSTKKKKQSTVKLDTVDIAKAKKKKTTAKKTRTTAKLTQEELIVQAEPLVETVPVVEPVQKKDKVKGKKKKRQEESEHLKVLRRKGREISFNQSLAAYISVCVSHH